ncbi:hypothetical protein BGZ76_008286 [Entomortierella beljakovae]|nr:hypothetical protein BGZ76_008286 [Entomortierella beljakovae]
MFARLAKRTSGHRPVYFLKSTGKHHNLSNTNSISAVVLNFTRHQSSSSSRDNDNNNGSDMEPMSTNDTPINASFELHRVDLAHGSFFALHRPLLGITNGPMFTNNNPNNLMNDEDYEGKCH